MSKQEIAEYKDKYAYDQREEKARSMRESNPDKFPVILLRSKVSKYTLPAHR